MHSCEIIQLACPTHPHLINVRIGRLSTTPKTTYMTVVFTAFKHLMVEILFI